MGGDAAADARRLPHLPVSPLPDALGEHVSFSSRRIGSSRRTEHSSLALDCAASCCAASCSQEPAFWTPGQCSPQPPSIAGRSRSGMRRQQLPTSSEAARRMAALSAQGGAAAAATAAAAAGAPRVPEASRTPSARCARKPAAFLWCVANGPVQHDLATCLKLRSPRRVGSEVLLYGRKPRRGPPSMELRAPIGSSDVQLCIPRMRLPLLHHRAAGKCTRTHRRRRRCPR